MNAKFWEYNVFCGEQGDMVRNMQHATEFVKEKFPMIEGRYVKEKYFKGWRRV